MTLDEYPGTFLAYFEALTISKDDFGQWCDARGRKRSRFWFGDIEDAPDPTRSGLAGRPTPKHLYKAELQRRAKAGLMLDAVSKEAKELHNWLRSKYPKINSGTPKAIENNIRDKHRELKTAKPPK